MATRSLLHKNKLEDFNQWLVKNGWKIEDTKGDFEALRASKNKRKLVLYDKLYAKEHLSVRDCDISIVRAYLNEKKNQKTKKAQN